MEDFMHNLSDHKHADAMTSKGSGTALTFAAATFIIGKLLHIKLGWDPFLGEIGAATILCTTFALAAVANVKEGYVTRTFQFITILALLVANVYMNSVGQQVTVMQLSMDVVETDSEGVVIETTAPRDSLHPAAIFSYETVTHVYGTIFRGRPEPDIRYNKTTGKHEVHIKLPSSCGGRPYWGEIIPKYGRQK